MKKKIPKQDELTIRSREGKLLLRLKSHGMTEEEKKELTELIESILQKKEYPIQKSRR